MLKNKTFDLYMLEPAQLRALLYEDALKLKIAGARVAMKRYGENARLSLEVDDGKYEEWLDKYQASDKAKKFNQELILEMTNTE